MNNYIFSNENMIQIGILGITLCQKCKNHDIQILYIDKTTADKYLYCKKCRNYRKLEQEDFDKLLVYSKNVPQNEDVLIEIWESLMEINIENTIDYINKNVSKGFEQVRKELYQLVTYKSIELYDNLASKFLKNISEESVDCFLTMIINQKNENDDNKVLKEQTSGKKIKKTSKEKLEKFMYENYQKTINNILDEEPCLFEDYILSFEANVSEDDENNAIISDTNYLYKDMSEELFSIKIVNSICHLYSFVEEYKKDWSDYNEYDIPNIHRVLIEIDSNEVNVKKVTKKVLT